MQEDFKFSAAEANLVVHATEDLEKILRSLQATLGVQPEKFSSMPSEGHYKNRILMLRATFSSAEAADLASLVSSNLNSSLCKTGGAPTPLNSHAAAYEKF